jgi:hypothetical protein
VIETTRNKFKANTIGSMLDQLVVILCGLIIPRLILTSFGSEVNGLVNSITQFLGLITFLELGTGAVVKSALYKPLAENNIESISKIVRVAKRFFNILGGILAVYVVILIFVFPHINQSNFSFAFTALLIGAISIGSFAQYFFGIVDTSIITANQRGYLYYFVNIFCLVLNVVLVYFLIKFGYSIQIVKFVSSIIFLIRPIVLHIYTRRHFKIDKNIEYDNSVIPQRWNGVAQHIAAIVLENTDICDIIDASKVSLPSTLLASGISCKTNRIGGLAQVNALFVSFIRNGRKTLVASPFFYVGRECNIYA